MSIMEQIQNYEEVLLLLLENELTCGETLNSVEDMKHGNFLKVVESAKCEEIFTRYLEKNVTDTAVDKLLAKSVSTYVENECKTPEQQLEVLCVAVACLHIFIQSNWTGPALDTDVLPWLLSCWTTQDMVDCLVLDGEACNTNMTHPEFLLMARITITACCNSAQPLPSSEWWRMRCLFIHQQVLEEFSPTLHADITRIMGQLEKCEPLMTSDTSLVCFHLEAARAHLYYRYVTQSHEHMKIAVKAANMTVNLVGALGLRTKFQEKELPQLTVKVSVPENHLVGFTTVQLEHMPKDLKLDDEVRLDKIKFSDDSAGQFPLMHPIEQAVMLGIFHQTLTSQPKDDLSNEELLPYLTCILSHPLAWSLQMSALLQRSQIEKDSSRSVERAMMQTEELVHCFLKDKPDVVSRHHLIFASYLPPRWAVEAQHAHQLVSLGIVKSALDIYLRLQMWDRVIVCYNVLNLRHKASEVIKQELNKKETVRLWCLLGDATDDPACYEKAWELSGHRSGQAQRHWGLFYFNKRKYGESIPHFQQSLAINSLQVSLWFRLGFAALDQQDWSLCATAYQRYCSLDPESFEAWNNLSKAYVKLNQKMRAWKTLQEALKWNYENWKLWDNYMVVSVDVGQFHEVMKAYNRILDLKPKHIDVEVLRILVDALTDKFKDPQLIGLAEKLFIRLTQEVRNNPSVWQLYVKLMLIDESNKESFESMEKVVSSLQKGFWSSIQDSHFERDIKECLLTMQITSQLVDATLKCCEKCVVPQKSVQMLASSKLCLQTLIARVKKFYAHTLTEETDAAQSELAVLLQGLEEKLEEIVVEIQRQRGST